jgi:ActR/RegA family two-component response regulator
VPERTTLTLDDDVAARLRAKARSTARPFKSVVNETLRAGLDTQAAESPALFVVVPHDLGTRPGIELDSIEDLLDQIEGADRR